jgi:hypothetical protein
LQLRSDKDSMDVVFNNQHIAVNALLPSFNNGFYISSEMDLESIDPLRLRVLKGGYLSAGRVDKLGKVSGEIQDDVWINNKGLESPLNLLINVADRQALLRASGDLLPLDMNIALNADNVLVEGVQYGPSWIQVTLSGKDNVTVKADGQALGLDLVGEGHFNKETRRGDFLFKAADLTQLNDFTETKCITLDGSVSLDKRVRAQGTVQLKDLDLKALDTPTQNVNFAGQWSYNQYRPNEGFYANGKLSIPLLDIGLRLRQLDADLRWQNGNLIVDKLTGQTLGGVLYSENQRWQLNTTRNTLLINLEGIELSQLVALENYPGLKVTGKVDASLPLEIDSARIQVIGGRIEAIESGEIHLPVNGSGRTGAQKEAFDALQNFHFEVLSGGISGPIALDPEGMLVSNLTIRGMNPDMERQVSLHLNIEQNTYPIFQTLALFDKVKRIGQCKPQ